MQFALSTALVALAGLVGLVASETHTVRVDNRCDDGVPQLVQDGQERLLDGQNSYTSNGPIVSAIAYLQTDFCWFTGENCTVVEMTLQNDDPGSVAEISVTSPYRFSVSTAFGYYNGCEGAGAYCADDNCLAQGERVPCTEEDVDLLITFCI